MAINKDSDEVVQFMVLFARLKDWIDDDPGNLSKIASEDESISDLCNELFRVAHRLTGC